MGCLVAFELCCSLAKRRDGGGKLHLPLRVVVASMSSPDTPKETRPWPDTRYLNDEEFQVSCAREPFGARSGTVPPPSLAMIE